jgi:hypothetical protein
MRKSNEIATDSPAIIMLRAARFAPREQRPRRSSRELGYGMGHALRACLHLGMRFDVGDIKTFYSALGGDDAFGAEGAERYYRNAVDAGHETACRSFEAFFNRPPFIYSGKRIRVGSLLRWEGEWFTITSFGQHNGAHVVVACSYTWYSVKGRWEIRREQKVHHRIRLTSDELQLAERQRLASNRRDALIKINGAALDRWAETNWMYPEMHHFINKLPDASLREIKAWCEANERRVDRCGEREERLTAAPVVVAEALEAHRVGKVRRRAKEEIETALRERLGAKDYERVEVTDCEIDARITGESIADILAKGTLVPCSACGGKALVDCDVCGSEYVKCQACEGKGRVPPALGGPDEEDYQALLRTLDLTIEGGSLVGGAHIKLSPPPPPAKARTPLHIQASAKLIATAGAAQDPAVVAFRRARELAGEQ